MAKSEKTKKLPRPPYGSFKSAKTFIESLNKTVLPDEIDRSMMSKMSGVTQAEVLSAFRFLGLLNENDETQGSLQELVSAYGTKDWQATLGKVIQDAYKPVVAGLNLKSGTAKGLADAFKKNAKLEGNMLLRTITFYLAALKEAEIPHSPHFKAPPRPRRNTNGRAKSNSNSESGDDNDPPPSPPSENTISYPVRFKGKPAGQIIVPNNMDEDDLKVFDLTVQLVKAYASQESK